MKNFKSETAKSSFFVVFSQIGCPQMEACRDSGNCPNDTKHNALERGGLGACFELINSHIN